MLPSQRHLFSLPPDRHYLNAAATSPILASAEAAAAEGLRRERDPSTIPLDDFFDQPDRVRDLFARLVRTEAERVALVPAVSYANAVLAKNLALEAGQEVVMLGAQFPSHVYPWRELAERAGARTVIVEAPGPLGMEGRGAQWNERLLEAITPQTGLVAVPQIHWSDGTVFDLEAVGERAREVGAAFVVDGTQSVGAMPFNWSRVRPDALACAGYKWLLGPHSMGVLVVGDRFRDGRPLEETWVAREGSREFSGLTSYVDAYEPGASRFDVGERSNGVLLPWLAAGLEQVLAWTPEAIQARCRALADRIGEGARAKGYGVGDHQAGHLFGLRAPDGLAPEDIRQRLAAAGAIVSVRGGVLRVSPHVYNTEADADALVAALPLAA